MRHILRLLGSRYGVAFSLVVLIALIVGVAKVVGDAPPTVGSGRVGIATPTATTSEQDDDGIGSPPSPPLPSTSPGAADPQTVALSFTQAWLHHTGVTSQQWTDGIAPYSTPVLKAELDGADPGTVQASAVKGDPSVVNRSESFVQIVVPLDSGTLTLGLSATNGRWLVDAVDWARP
ncbi:hypothetical protein [Rugosimonospora africana]|uniref:Uncharacterized protein n=1 Tax=Rugosimonospora africana TaxID=556532 RepID=A0A8J3QWI6_9ACTN|nr:hypothetical protein [Rugosimonospora africana]GIH18168.1 hypothetical protein Raf01_63400 [Rugosimonospora africana]